MATEIERKFLVKGDFKDLDTNGIPIIQAYLSSIPERTVRVRVKGDKAFITIKGAVDHSGTSRFEWEKEITVEEANELLGICEPGMIIKERYPVSYGGHTFEVDVFSGDNEGLVIAEIELGTPDEYFEAPLWLGREVTGEKRYYNSFLTNHPFKTWTE